MRDRQQRQALSRIVSAATTEVLALGYESTSLVAGIPAIASMYGTAAAVLACDWHDAERTAAAVGAPYSAEPAPMPDSARYRALVAWGLTEGSTQQTQLALISGGLSRIVANAHRDTVRLNAFADPDCDGWARFGQGDSCDFCRMLISSGEVYREATAKFAAHDTCNCVAGPSFAEASQVGDYVRSKRRLADSTRRANNRRAREWIAANT